MAARVFAAYNWTPTQVADTVAMTNSTYMAIEGGVATQVVNVLDIYINGMAGTAAPMHLVLARSSTIGTTPTALASPNSDGPLNPSATTLGANAVNTYVAAAAGPQRSSSASLVRLNLGINAFGGSYRWTASPLQKYQIVGTAATAGASTLSALNVAGTSGLVGCSITYEPE